MPFKGHRDVVRSGLSVIGDLQLVKVPGPARKRLVARSEIPGADSPPFAVKGRFHRTGAVRHAAPRLTKRKFRRCRNVRHLAVRAEADVILRHIAGEIFPPLDIDGLFHIDRFRLCEKEVGDAVARVVASQLYAASRDQHAVRDILAVLRNLHSGRVRVRRHLVKRGGVAAGGICRKCRRADRKRTGAANCQDDN